MKKPMEVARNLAVVLCLVAPALGESVLVPSVNAAGKVSLMEIRPREGAKWDVSEIELPTIQGLPVTAIDFVDDQVVLSALVRSRPEKPADVAGKTMLWISACYLLDGLPQALAEKRLQAQLADSCGFNSHSIAAFRRQLEASLRINLEGKADWAYLPKLLDQHPENNVNHLLPLAHYAPFLGVAPGLKEPDNSVSLLYVFDFTAPELILVAGGTTAGGAYMFRPEQVEHGRYMPYMRDSRSLNRILSSGDTRSLDRANKERKFFVYDLKTRTNIFETRGSFQGLGGALGPTINASGTHFLCVLSDPPAADQPEPVGRCGVFLFDIATGTEKRLTAPDVDASVVGWCPDGKRFLYAIGTDMTPAIWLGRIGGTSEKLDWKLEGIPDAYRAFSYPRGRAWLGNGDQFVSIWPEFLDKVGEAPRYRMHVVLNDIATRTSRVVAEYEMVESVRLDEKQMPKRIP